MTDKEKLEKLKKLADAMHYAAQHLTTDASRLHKAMDEYHKFIIHEWREEPVSKEIGDYDHKAVMESLHPELKEEPVNEDLEEAASSFARKDSEGISNPANFYYIVADKARIFRAGAKWQKENLWKHADGDDLPEYDREVIAILDYDFGHYKVVYAHRPNPNGWNCTNIDTGEKEHFEPVIYDKGGWNQPHVLYWLDAKLPYEENKIDKEIEL